MPGTYVTSAGGYVNTSGSHSISSAVTVTAGQLAIASLCWQGGSVPAWTVSDNLGNTWTRGSHYVAAGGVWTWYSIITTGGSMTVTYDSNDATSRNRWEGVSVWDAPGVTALDQMTRKIAPHGTTISGSNQAAMTGDVTYADTLIISTCMFMQATAVKSTTGDIQVQSIAQTGTGAEQFVLYRNATGPGTGIVNIEWNSGDTGYQEICVNTFSVPLERPTNLSTQVAIRSGCGYDNNEPSPNLDWNRPLTITMPYVPEVGNTLLVGVAPIGAAAAGDCTVTDSYGNTYTQEIFDPASGSVVATAAFVCEVSAVPASGPFQLQLNISPIAASGAVYQETMIAVQEFAGAPGTPDSVGCTSVSNVSPIARILSDTITGVPEGNLLWGFAWYGGGNNQDSVSWASLDGYSIPAVWNTIMWPGVGSNNPRMGSGCIFYKYAPTADDYYSTMDATVVGNYSQQGGIVLLSLSIDNPCSCPRVCYIYGG